VGALLDFLGESGMDSSTLIVLTADHGESLGEDNYYFQHGHQLNEASLHVPLLLRHPDLPAAKTVSTPVSLVDVFPTVAELVGIEGPRAAAGRSLAPDILGVDVHAPPRTLIAYTVPGNHLVSARRGRWKVIGTPTLGDDGPGDFAAFEVRDLTAGRDEPVEPEAIGPVFAELCRAVEEARDRIAPGFGAPVELDRHDQQRLRELGYVD
jgi:arylsulfatase A-like enzyme